jgi:hypothetical protein
MNWWAGAVILVISAGLLRWLLRTGPRTPRTPAGWLPLSAEREAIYQSAAQEVETQGVIMAISLNDALEEHAAGRGEMAWNLVRLVAGEWERSGATLATLLQSMAKYMPEVRLAIPLRSLSSRRFKSRTMSEFFRTYELLDQLVFRSKLRFQLQVRMLRRAVQELSLEFRKVYGRAARLDHHPPEFWQALDPFFHDFDLLSKEILLAFRVFLSCLPDSALAHFAAQFGSATPRKDRSVSLSAHV